MVICGIAVQKPKGRRWRHGQGAVLTYMCRKGGPVRKAQQVRRADMKRPADIQAGTRAKQHPTRVEQIQICSRDGRLQPPIDDRLLPPSDPTQNIHNPSRSAEARGIVCPDTEAVKTMKQVGPIPRPCAARDVVDGAALGHGSAQGAIGRDGGGHLGLAAGKQHAEQQTTTEQEGAQQSEHGIMKDISVLYRCGFLSGVVIVRAICLFIASHSSQSTASSGLGRAG